MIVIQIVIVLWVLYAAVRTYSRFRQRVISVAEYLTWTAFWIAVGIGVLDPNLSQILANAFGVGRGADAIFYLGIIGLSYMSFRIYLKTKDLEQKITLLVRHIALHPGEGRNDEWVSGEVSGDVLKERGSGTSRGSNLSGGIDLDSVD